MIKGGSTVFTRLNVRVDPQKGSAIFWYNLFRNGEGILDTVHGACPVLLGEKWGWFSFGILNIQSFQKLTFFFLS